MHFQHVTYSSHGMRVQLALSVTFNYADNFYCQKRVSAFNNYTLHHIFDNFIHTNMNNMILKIIY